MFGPEPQSPTTQVQLRRRLRQHLPIPHAIDLDSSENEDDDVITVTTSVHTGKRSQDPGRIDSANMRTLVTSRTKRNWSSAQDEVVASWFDDVTGASRQATVTTRVSSTPLAKRIRSQLPTPPDSGRTARFTSGPSEGGRRPTRSSYWFGDAFCGAGGMSCAAQLAGLRVAYGFDNNKHAMASYGLNHVDAVSYLANVEEFLAIEDEDLKVDILHMSPPCQYFAPCHTCPGKDDEKNSAVIFAIQQLLAKTKPRVVTMEETFGLVQGHPHYFNIVLRIFTDHGFSLRYRIVNLAEYGCPQGRRRVVIIAAW